MADKPKYDITGDFEEEVIDDKKSADEEELELEVEEEQAASTDKEDEEETAGKNDEEQEDAGASENEDEGETGEEEESDDADEVAITLEGEKPAEEEDEASAPAWVKKLRKQKKEDAKRIRELEAQLSSQQNQDQGVPKLGPKPTLEGCEWDEAEFERQLTEWHETKRKVEAKEKEIEDEQRAAQEAWNQKRADYETAKKDLKFSGMDEAEEIVQNTLSISQYGSIIQGAKQSAALVAYLGNNAERLGELAKIKDPIEFIFAVAHLEAKLKVTSRKTRPATKPEKRVKVPAHNSQSASQQLEALRAEAEKTGDYTKVTAFKRSQREASAAS